MRDNHSGLPGFVCDCGTSLTEFEITETGSKCPDCGREYDAAR